MTGEATSGILKRGGVGPFASETVAIAARFTTPPTYAREVLMNNLVNSLIVGGVWRKLDALYILAAADSQAAKLNWLSTSFNATEVNAPTFTADRGFAGNGSTSYLNTNLTPSTAGGKATLNSASLGVWINNDPGPANSNEIGANDATGKSVIWAYRLADTFALASMNANATNGAVVATALGFTGVSRTASNVLATRRNKTSLATSSDASVNLPTLSLTILALSGSFNFSSRRVAVAWYGAGLTTTESDAFYDALNTYLTAIGGA